MKSKPNFSKLILITFFLNTGFLVHAQKSDCMSLKVFITEDVSVHKSPNGMVTDKILVNKECNCAVVHLLKMENNWAEIDNNRWIPISQVVVYSIDNSILYQKPQNNSSVIIKVGAEELKLLHCANKWAYVKTSKGEEGWLAPENQGLDPEY